MSVGDDHDYDEKEGAIRLSLSTLNQRKNASNAGLMAGSFSLEQYSLDMAIDIYSR